MTMTGDPKPEQAAPAIPERRRWPLIARWRLAVVAGGALGVAAMSSPLPIASPANQAARPAAADLHTARVDPDRFSVSPGKGEPARSSASRKPESTGRSAEAGMAALRRLVEELCGVPPDSVSEGQGAYMVDVPLARTAHPCLDAVVMMFDRDHPSGPAILFDVLSAKEERYLPVLHISAIHQGPLPYVHLKSGKTLYVGAMVDGWELESIDQDGVAFRHGDRIFRLDPAEEGDHP